jgi:hypothetical protein
VRLAVVIPGDYLHETGLGREDFSPSVVPEEIGGEDPVLAVGDLVAEMRREPGRNGCSVSQYIQGEIL